MCNCGGSVSSSGRASKANYSSNSYLTKLANIRNDLAILYNLTKDISDKSKLKSDREYIDKLIADYRDSGVKAEHSFLTSIISDIRNEYAKHNHIR